MRRLTRYALLVTLAVVGCGGPSASLKVNPTVVSQFPPEARMWVFDAENEVIIALDKRDAAATKVKEIGKEIDRARKALETAESRNDGSTAVAKARVSWHEARQEHAESLVEVADVAVICARAMLELNKAKLVVRFDILGDEEKFSVKPYAEQHEKCARNLLELTQDSNKLEKSAKAAEEKWRQVRLDYVRRTGDHNHGMWID